MMTINLLELRNYLLKPRMLEHFIDYFETHFIVSQEQEKMPVLGQFRVLSEPDRFVWLRGFHDMQMRLESLQNFYGGPVWEKYGPRANEMMLEWHNVRLLRPLTDIADLTCGWSASTVAADLAAGTISPNPDIVAIDFYQALPGQRDVLIDRFQEHVVPIYQQEAIHLRGCFVAELGENKFSRLPVIQNEDELVVITAYDSQEAYLEKQKKIVSHTTDILGSLLRLPPTSMLLSPTLRSPVRYIPT
jgi:hypothetical protein